MFVLLDFNESSINKMLPSKNLKKRRMRILSARIFLSLLAGKLRTC